MSFGFNLGLGGNQANAQFNIGGFGFGGGNKAPSQPQNNQNVVPLAKYNADMQNANNKINELATRINKYECERAMLTQYQTQYITLQNEFKIKQEIIMKYETQINVLVQQNSTIVQSQSQNTGNIDVYKKEIENKEKEIAELRNQIKGWEAENNRDDAQIAQLSQALAMTKEILAKSQSNDSIDASQIQSQNESLNKLSSELNKWRSEKEESEKLVAQLKVEIKNRDDQITMINQNIVIINNQLNETKNLSLNVNVQLQEKDQRYGNLKAEYDSLSLKFSTCTTDLERKNKLLEESEKKIDGLMGQISAQIATIESLKVSAGSWEGKTMELQNTIYNVTNQLNVLQKNYASKDLEITHLNSMIELKDRRIAELTTEINKKIVIIKGWEAENQKDDKTIESLQLQIEKYRKDIESWTKENTKDDAQIAELLKSMQQQSSEMQKRAEDNKAIGKRLKDTEDELGKKITIINSLKQIIAELRTTTIAAKRIKDDIQFEIKTDIQSSINTTEQLEITKRDKISLEVSMKKTLEMKVDLEKRIEELIAANANLSKEVAQIRNEKQLLEMQTKKTEEEFTAKLQAINVEISNYSKVSESYTTLTMTASQNVGKKKEELTTQFNSIDAAISKMELSLA